MNNSIRYFVVFWLLLATCPFDALAQPKSVTDYHNSVEYNNMRNRERESLRRNEKNIENGFRPNTPSSSGSKYRFEKTREAAADKERWANEREAAAAAKVQAEKQAVIDDARNREVEKYNAEIRAERAVAAAKAEAARGVRLEKQIEIRDKYLKQSAIDNKDLLGDEDRKDLEQDVIYAWHFDLNYDKELKSAGAIKAFKEKKNTASYEELMQLANGASQHARFATDAYADILKRFPEHRQDVELATLAAMPYYFGSRRPYLPKFDKKFSTYSIYELADEAEKIRLLLAFDALATKYPKEALSAAGKCRTGQNPFLLLANNSEANEEKCATYHMLVLHCDYRKSVPPEFKNFSDRAAESSCNEYVESALQPSGRYLMKHRRSELKKIKRAEWASIIELSGIHRLYYTRAFKSPSYSDYANVKKYGEWGFIWRILPNLWKS